MAFTSNPKAKPRSSIISTRTTSHASFASIPGTSLMNMKALGTALPYAQLVLTVSRILLTISFCQAGRVENLTLRNLANRLAIKLLT